MKKVIFSIGFIFIAMSLIFFSFDGINAQTKLRDTPSSQKLKEKDIGPLVKEKNFFDKKLNETGDFTNDFVDNGDGTITDQATGLMWEQGGSKRDKSLYMAKKYVKKLNKKKFAGYNDWRIPTIEELYSLLEPNKSKQLYINPVFSTKPYHCWSADRSDLPTLVEKRGVKRYLTLDYKEGTFSDANEGDQPGGSSASNWSSFIKAVRSLQ